MESINLNIGQKRVLHNTLMVFEKTLRYAEWSLDQDGMEGIFYRQVNPLSPAERDLLRLKIGQTMQLLAEFASKLNLEPYEEDLSRHIKAELSDNWTNLMNSQPANLKGYGKTSLDSARIINPYIDQLARAALELSSLFSTDHPETPDFSEDRRHEDK